MLRVVKQNERLSINWSFSSAQMFTKVTPAWPVGGIKSNTNFPIYGPKRNEYSFFLIKWQYFKIVQKVSKYFGYFNDKNCFLELLKIPQSGHTEMHMEHSGKVKYTKPCVIRLEAIKVTIVLCKCHKKLCNSGNMSNWR